MQMRIILFSLILGLTLAACTSSTQPNITQSPSPTTAPTEQPTQSPTPSPTEEATIKSTIKPTQQPTKTPAPSPTQSPKSEVQSYSTGSSTTNINITSNGTNVKIITKNSQRYAQLNGKEVPIDTNGCYDYDQNGTKIHTCINDNRFRE